MKDRSHLCRIKSARSVSFKHGEREVSTSADVRVFVSVSSKAGGLTSRREREKNTSFSSSFKIIAGSHERLLNGLEGTAELVVKRGHFHSPMSRVSKLLMHQRKVVSGSRPGAGTILSRSGISGDGRKSVDSCNTKVFTSYRCSLLPHVHMHLTRSLILPSHHARTSFLRQEMERFAYFARVTGPCFDC
jgi:hypothetical protein